MLRLKGMNGNEKALSLMERLKYLSEKSLCKVCQRDLGYLLLSYKCFWVYSTFEITDLDLSILEGLIAVLEALQHS